MADPQAVAATRLRDAYQHAGYVSAIMDMTRWVMDVALKPGMDSATLMATLGELGRLAAAQADGLSGARQVGEFTDHIINGLAANHIPNPAQPVSDPRDCDSAPFIQQERPSAAGGQPADHSDTHERAAGASAPAAMGKK